MNVIKHSNGSRYISRQELYGDNTLQEAIFKVIEDGFERVEQMPIGEFEIIKDPDRGLKRRAKSYLSQYMFDKITDAKFINRILHNFINPENVAETIALAVGQNMNAIMYGKGGFGKSEMVTAVLSQPEFANKVFIKSLNEATTEEDLFGGINMKALNETGEILYNLDKSFITSEIVVFEEMLDANPQVLSALKDALTSGYVRNGKQVQKLKTKVIIGLTNKNPKEIAQENDSVEALLQRFPIQVLVQQQVDAKLIVDMAMKYGWERKDAAILIDAAANRDASIRNVLQITKVLQSPIEITTNLVIAGLSIAKLKKDRSLITEQSIERILKQGLENTVTDLKRKGSCKEAEMYINFAKTPPELSTQIAA